ERETVAALWRAPLAAFVGEVVVVDQFPKPSVDRVLAGDSDDTPLNFGFKPFRELLPRQTELRLRRMVAQLDAPRANAQDQRARSVADGVVFLRPELELKHARVLHATTSGRS